MNEIKDVLIIKDKKELHTLDLYDIIIYNKREYIVYEIHKTEEYTDVKLKGEIGLCEIKVPRE